MSKNIVLLLTYFLGINYQRPDGFLLDLLHDAETIFRYYYIYLIEDVVIGFGRSLKN